MNLPLFIVFGIFLHNNFPTESRKVTPQGIVYERYKADAFRRITSAHLIETHIVNKLGSCAFRCLKNFDCVSFNFGNPVSGKHVCELLRTDKYNSRSSYVSSADLHYFYPVNKCMNSSLCQHGGSCYPDYDNDDYHCVCNRTKGRNCELYFGNCTEIRSAGYTTDGIYTIRPDEQGLLPVYCDLSSDSNGWIVIQRRFNGLVNFYRGWQEFKTGFGDLKGEFWFGNDKIHRLSKTRKPALNVDIEDWDGNKVDARYSSFLIADESDSYRLSISGFLGGTAGDSLVVGFEQKAQFVHNGMKFSTPDKDNDLASYHCASIFEGAWWHNDCYSSHLNGRYLTNDKLNSGYKGVCWWSFKSDPRSLKKTQMKLLI